MTGAPARRTPIDGASRPRLPRHAKLHFDPTREAWVLLAPERVLVPDETALEILHFCDGTRRVDDIVDLLAAKYAAEHATIAADVVALLQELADKGLVTDVRDSSS